MHHKQPLFLRVATKIAGEVQRRPARKPVDLPTQLWERAARLARQQHLAAQRNWQAAEQSVQASLRQTLTTLEQELSSIIGQLQPAARRYVADARQIVADLDSLEDEFGNVTIDLESDEIAVETEAIELEGVALGPFEIRLCYGNLGNGPPDYRVIAVEPNPASSNDSVTHPHVQDENVCEGEAFEPIRTALAQGRIYDFFIIVAGLLRTYNQASPYVSLENWKGICCTECGTLTYEDERWSCDHCDAILCEDCRIYCPDCDGTFCSECTTPCQACGDRRCQECIEVCGACLEEFCPSCLEENGNCEECHAQEMEANAAENGEHESATNTEVQPNRVEEVTVSA